jgi:restriction system protein
VCAIIKGWFCEKATQFGMWMGLDANVYRRVHDLVLPSQGGTTQIDHVLVSVYGIFVIETKNMKGWIFGDERSPQWTQSIYGKKTRFQNPLRQNYRHVKAIAEFLGVPDDVLRPVVFFIGDCDFKTPMPPNVLSRGLCGYIQSFRRPVFSPEEAGDIFTRLTQAKAAPAATHTMHVAGLRERHGGDTCPKCGSALVLRTARSGLNAGGSFFGCSGFPKCRYTRTA